MGRRLRRGLETDGEGVGCDEWGVSADAGGAFRTVTSVSFSPDGTKVVGLNDDTVELWDVTRGSVCRRWRGILRVHSVSFSPDGTKVARGLGQDGEGVMTSGERPQTLEGHPNV